MNRIFLFAACSALAAFGGTIIQTSGLPNGGGELVKNNVTDGQDVLASWTQTGTYANVSVSAEFNNENQTDPETGFAYLTTSIGPGALAPIASASFSIPGGNFAIGQQVTLFPSISLLGPGTYYLVITGPANDNNLGWTVTTAPTVTTDSGVTDGLSSLSDGASINTASPTASTFSTPFFALDLLYDVEGTLQRTTTPEPGAFVLTGLGLAVAASLRFRKS